MQAYIVVLILFGLFLIIGVTLFIDYTLQPAHK